MQGYVPSVEVHEEGELPVPQPGVRYKGSANTRVVYLSELQGTLKPGERPGGAYLSWERDDGHFIPWGAFVDACGSAERAAEFLAANKHDFVAEEVDLVLPDEEEFNIGGVVE